MINPCSLSSYIREAVLQNRGWDSLPPHEQLEKLAQLTPDEMFEHWCEWEGLIGWSATIRQTLDSIREAEVKT